MTENIICTTCPFGCPMKVEYDASGILSITGNRCKRGISYAEQEITDPRRMLATTMGIRNSVLKLMPVKTSTSVPRDMMKKIVQEVSSVTVTAPIAVGHILIKNVCDSGTDIIATRNAELTNKNQ